jgi:hypothetical protein
MLSDREADEIERGRRAGVGGPLVLKWIDQLLADRRERIQQLDHLRRRLNQAFRYLDGLVRDARRPQTTGGAGARPPECPKCGKRYARAAGESPSGVVYYHADRTECRVLGAVQT